VQVAPIKPTLKAAGTKRLKLKCDQPLSNFAFNFNVRHYNSDSDGVPSLLSSDGEEERARAATAASAAATKAAQAPKVGFRV
jgi:hypothetical protein